MFPVQNWSFFVIWIVIFANAIFVYAGHAIGINAHNEMAGQASKIIYAKHALNIIT